MPKGCKIGIGSTGVYHINLTKYLGKEYDVRIINSFILKKFKDFGGRRATRMMLKNLLN
ncbi:transposase ISC1190 [Sulfolobus islandicus M.14.25]|uniref:Transposase ISC1190 n=3 Tax=Saccharolobus islandicus TaxID=43080 RepID=C4KK02_SACI6|nr:transposase ISC1190 [Sulfolobus islandicus M.14.25]ACP56133.1 transposase ISC1190 [Sulfolobus islandicus M.16.27]ACR42797.1 transposase ISC1190 [Sulfolobus islandicus M.16.4]